MMPHHPQSFSVSFFQARAFLYITLYSHLNQEINTDPYISLKSLSSFLNYLTVCFIVKENVPYVSDCHVSLGFFNMSYLPSIFLTFMIAVVLRTIGQLFRPLMWVCGSQTSKWLQRFLSPCIPGRWSTLRHCTWGDLCDQENTTEVRACTQRPCGKRRCSLCLRLLELPLGLLILGEGSHCLVRTLYSPVEKPTWSRGF